MSTPIRGNNATVTPDSSVTVPADGGYGYVAAPAEQSDTNAPAASAGAKGNAGAPSSRYYTYTAEPAYGYSRPHNPGITNTNAAGGGNVPDASAAQQPPNGYYAQNPPRYEQAHPQPAVQGYQQKHQDAARNSLPERTQPPQIHQEQHTPVQQAPTAQHRQSADNRFYGNPQPETPMSQQAPLTQYQQQQPSLREQVPPQQVGAPGPVLPVSEPQPSVADRASGAFAPQYPQAFEPQPSAPVQPQYTPVSPQEDLRAPAGAGEAMNTVGAEPAGSQESAPSEPLPPVSAPQGGQLSPIVYGVSPVSGATTWASLLGLGEVVDIDRAVASGRPLVLVARTTETSIQACFDFLSVHRSGVDIAAILCVADAPGAAVRPVKHKIKILAGANSVISVPWVPRLRAVSLTAEAAADKAVVKAVKNVISGLPAGVIE